MLGNIGPMQLLIIFLIVLLIFGTKKLRNVGGDLGSAIRDFRKGMSNEEEREEDKEDATTGESTSAEPPESGSEKPKS
ncbi:MAG: twin-arginine translocase TatA/TatE family subunit [Wenzhouxiangellaceae bacterium]